MRFCNSKIDPKVIDCIIIATTTPDNTFPSTATKVQNFFKLKDIPSFDIQAVCSGFIYGLQIADSFIKSEKFKNILLIGAETLSKIVDWKDRRTCVLFGDGAGSMILSAKKKMEFYQQKFIQMVNGLIVFMLMEDLLLIKE